MRPLSVRSELARAALLGLTTLEGAGGVACTKNGKEIPAAIDVAKAVADESRYAREGRPRGSLGRGATPECSVFEDYVESCPLVPTCTEVRVAHEKLVLNVCTNERGAIERVVPCGSARNETESLCTSASFLPCDRVVGTPCTWELAVCDLGRFELAVAQCCVDESACTVGTLALRPRRSM